MKENDVEILLGENSLRSPELSFKMPRSLNFERNGNGAKSQALDSLINQNEDLMARLRAASKRTSDLEDQLELQQQEINQLKHDRARLKEHILILNEKETLYRDRTDSAVALNSDLKEENFELIQRLKKVERAFRRLFKYREKIRAAMPDLKVFKKKALRAHELNEHLKIQTNELSSRLQRIHSETSEAQTRLVEDYEFKIASLSQQLMESQMLAEDRESLNLQKIEIENRCVELERQKSMLSQESFGLKGDLEHFRKQSKELLVVCETQKSQVAEKIRDVQEKSEENQKLLEQVESLQVLWKEKQMELERAQEKNRSLQKLNQDISIKLNEAKKQMHEIKVSAERSQFTHR